MSVFTPLERHELEVFLAPYGLGRLRDFQGIAAGSENSNFFVSLEQGEYVLTLVERGPVADLPFFIELLDVLHDAGLPVPYALRTQDGLALRSLAEKPALLQPRLSGKHVREANAHHCQEVGRLLAHRFLGAVGIGEHHLGVLGKGAALGRERHAARRAREELHAQFVLECGDLLAQRGLGDVQPGRGLQQAARLAHAQKVTQLPQFHSMFIYTLNS